MGLNGEVGAGDEDGKDGREMCGLKIKFDSAVFEGIRSVYESSLLSVAPL